MTVDARAFREHPGALASFQPPNRSAPAPGGGGAAPPRAAGAAGVAPRASTRPSASSSSGGGGGSGLYGGSGVQGGKAHAHLDRARPSAALCDITSGINNVAAGLGTNGKSLAEAMQVGQSLARTGSMLKSSANGLGGSRSQATCSTFCGSGSGSGSGSNSASSAAYGGTGAAADVDEDVHMEDDDPQAVAEYAPDIYRNLGRAETLHQPRPDYMESQTDLNHRMRAILIDWLVEIHMKYKLKTETLFLAVHLVDRFLQVMQVPRKRLQLCGVTAMLIAAKFEEIYPPEVRDFVYITDNAYTKDDILDMEVVMLNKLRFLICVPTAAHFLERYARVSRCSEQHRHLMQFLLELTLQEFAMIKYPPSHLAAAAVYLSNKLLKQQSAWPAPLASHSHLGEALVKGCAKEMCTILEVSREREERTQLRAVRRKFSHRRFSEVAKWSFMAQPAPAASRAGA